ncbi:hypothetical protein HIJ39_08045 [Sulfobacillus sp. DSM 109850]|uniref:Uncharacterized protein n=1 Tax=Sulfobacillus harzensis TaxID=2729629 RepID=A0A7Y0L2X5_9FIRM|nr:hypothetical protein [Sulfobacillus harzensis]
MVERVIVRGIGTLSFVGVIIFFIVGIPAIAVYLGLAGIAFWVFSLGWQKRYESVLEEPPEGFQPTGEVYNNPGGSSSKVAVYFRGIRRVYVKSQD